MLLWLLHCCCSCNFWIVALLVCSICSKLDWPKFLCLYVITVIFSFPYTAIFREEWSSVFIWFRSSYQTIYSLVLNTSRVSIGLFILLALLLYNLWVFFHCHNINWYLVVFLFLPLKLSHAETLQPMKLVIQKMLHCIVPLWPFKLARKNLLLFFCMNKLIYLKCKIVGLLNLLKTCLAKDGLFVYYCDLSAQNLVSKDSLFVIVIISLPYTVCYLQGGVKL